MRRRGMARWSAGVALLGLVAIGCTTARAATERATDSGRTSGPDRGEPAPTDRGDPPGADAGEAQTEAFTFEARGEESRRRMGEEGGSFALPGGGRLEVPEGALEESVELRARRIELTGGPVEAAGPGYRLEPAGLRFLRPATLVLPVDVSRVGRSEEPIAVAWSEDGSAWGLRTPALDDEEGAAVLPVRGFSLWVPVLTNCRSILAPACADDGDPAPTTCATPRPASAASPRRWARPATTATHAR